MENASSSSLAEKSIRRRPRWKWLAGVLPAILLGVGSFWHFGPPERTCLSCHEIQAAHDVWTKSSHRNVLCKDCHGSAISNGFHSLWENGCRVASHFSTENHDAMGLSEEQVVAMIERCRQCHEREHAAWQGSGHSLTYAAVFLNHEHNRAEQVNEDCLRCHGMFFDGSVDQIVTLRDVNGPWKLVKEELKERPAIPCLACHALHNQGAVSKRPDYSQPGRIASQRGVRITPASFYDRREKMYFEASLLPQPVVLSGEARLVVADDARQRLCFQCHAPGGEHLAGTGDDRTPRGVHRGLSCFACHSPHSLDARASCNQCHPQMSNCGLKVQEMNTTASNPDSRFNIHFVACEDCHTAGIPARKTQ